MDVNVTITYEKTNIPKREEKIEKLYKVIALRAVPFLAFDILKTFRLALIRRVTELSDNCSSKELD